MSRAALALVASLLALFGAIGFLISREDEAPTGVPINSLGGLVNTATPVAVSPTVGPPPPTVPPTPSFTLPYGHYPAGTKTGDAAIDPIIDAVYAKDLDSLKAMLHSVPAPCVVNPVPQIYREPGCGLGQVAGQPSPAYRVGCIETSVVTAEYGQLWILDNLHVIPPMFVEAKNYLIAVAFEPDSHHGTAYSVLFRGIYPYALHVDSRGLIGAGYCDEFQIQRERPRARFLLPPQQ
jgi:hypothetical protein